MQKQLSYKKLLWVTGFLTFFISAIADNLTTALVFATLLVTIEKTNKAFLVPAAINVVVASNAGGAWSPFGDITTLMIWNAGKAPFFDFFYLFPASFIGWVVTCYLLSLFVPDSAPAVSNEEESVMKDGAMGIVWLGLSTIAISVFAHQALHLPAIMGMMFGLSLLMVYSYNLKRRKNVDIGLFKSISKVENDTLLFFFGLMLAVGALSYIGYLALVADIYKSINPTLVNIGIGFLSAIVDNVPLTYAVLKANPAISTDQWLLVALAAGCGGSMIAFGSAAGVGVMGKMRGIYTFGSHMKYAWTVVVGFLVSVGVWYLQFEVLKIF
jgi:Na+/H+ antiporter NhaD/arsenite permease-like protein